MFWGGGGGPGGNGGEDRDVLLGDLFGPCCRFFSSAGNVCPWDMRVCLSLNSLICASEASSCFLLLVLPEPGTLCRGGFSDFLELVTDEVTPKGFGEVDGGRDERGGEGTERGLGEEQRERGRCWGDEEGSSLGGLGDAVLESAFGEVVRAMGEEDGEDSRRG